MVRPCEGAQHRAAHRPVVRGVPSSARGRRRLRFVAVAAQDPRAVARARRRARGGTGLPPRGGPARSDRAGDGRRVAVQNAYASYLNGLAIDPFARGGRQGFRQLIAAYREMIRPRPTASVRRTRRSGPDPRSAHPAQPGAPGRGSRCQGALANLRRRRVAAYEHLRVAQAREAAGEGPAARVSFAAALREDPSSRLALAGVERVQPEPLKKENDWRETSPASSRRLRRPPEVDLRAARGAAVRLWRRRGAVDAAHLRRGPLGHIRRWTGHVRWLRSAHERHIAVETPADLPPPRRAGWPSTRSRACAPRSSAPRRPTRPSPPVRMACRLRRLNGVGAQVDAAFAAVPSPRSRLSYCVWARPRSSARRTSTSCWRPRPRRARSSSSADRRSALG